VKVQPGAKVILEHWGGDMRLLARVRTIEPAAFTKISALGVEEQRVNVIADFVDPPELRRGIGDAFLVDARIVTWEGDNVIKIPVGALFRHSKDWAAFTIGNDKARLRILKLGHRNDLEAEVIEGLDANAKVIVYPSDKIHDGVAVTVSKMPRTSLHRLACLQV
jgi:HlyD family secretion protein